MVTMFGWDKRLAARALALEAPDHLRGRDDFGADELERNGFAEHDMGRPVHGAHAAPTEEALDPVFPARVCPQSRSSGGSLSSRTLPSWGQSLWLIMNSRLQVGQVRIWRGIGAYPEAV
jgi:hypothetical protein